MGTRDYKKFAPNSYYHIYNRGVGKIDIFKDKQDYKIFLSRLKENIFPNLKKDTLVNNYQSKSHTPYVRKALPEGSFTLVSYCLMPNHFHFLIKQNTDISVSKLISKICTSYSKCFNKKYKRVGSLFQDKFKAIQIEGNEYLLWLSVYIHLNPRVANLVRKDDLWLWSSYQEFFGLTNNLLCDKTIILDQFSNRGEYKKEIEKSFIPIKNKKDAMYDILNPELDFP